MSENETQDPVLTEDEKEALLDGVESGEVEVQSSEGPQYAEVAEFEVTPRNRIVTNSFPRLTNINRKLAGYVTKAASKLLNVKVEVAAGPLSMCTWGEFCEQASEIALMFEFSPKPLEGPAVVYLQKGLIDQLVETFYGGSKENPPRHETEGFTPGETNVTARLCEDVLAGIAETWQGLMELEPEKSGIHQSTDIVEIIENGANVISTEFDIHFADDQFYFHVVWPNATIASLLPVLEGQKRDRDAAEDARWEQVLRTRVPDARIDINSRVGNAVLSLRDVAALKPGDVIDIENPRKGTVFADEVPVLEGRFGVHDGCYALEATRWLRGSISGEPAAT
ncbi:MAG: FliM/FliN family flagellar motor switch protein [Woeseiaceae bacterium]|nr:FliM/FliN family flagellar motor switch protein [Woeseiaceae bacterium]